MDAESKLWWLLRGPDKLGPFSRQDLHAMVRDGSAIASDRLWKAGLEQPLPLGRIIALDAAPVAVSASTAPAAVPTPAGRVAAPPLPLPTAPGSFASHEDGRVPLQGRLAPPASVLLATEIVYGSLLVLLGTTVFVALPLHWPPWLSLPALAAIGGGFHAARRLGEGANWARITLAALLIVPLRLGIIGGNISLAALSLMPVAGWLALLAWLLLIPAVVLVLVEPGRSWFARAHWDGAGELPAWVKSAGMVVFAGSLLVRLAVDAYTGIAQASADQAARGQVQEGLDLVHAYEPGIAASYDQRRSCDYWTGHGELPSEGRYVEHISFVTMFGRDSHPTCEIYISFRGNDEVAPALRQDVIYFDYPGSGGGWSCRSGLPQKLLPDDCHGRPESQQ